MRARKLIRKPSEHAQKTDELKGKAKESLEKCNDIRESSVQFHAIYGDGFSSGRPATRGWPADQPRMPGVQCTSGTVAMVCKPGLAAKRLAMLFSVMALVAMSP